MTCIAGQANDLGSCWWIMSTMATIAVVPMLVIGILAQRCIVRGLSASGIKG